MLINPPEGLSPCESLAWWRSVIREAEAQIETLTPLAYMEFMSMGGETLQTDYGGIQSYQHTSYEYGPKVQRLKAMLDEARRDDEQKVPTYATKLRVIQSNTSEE